MDLRISDLEEENSKLRAMIRTLEIDLCKHRKLIALQQECLLNGNKILDHQQCWICEKIFINQSFLKSHIRRRHSSQEDEEDISTSSSVTESHSISTQTGASFVDSQDTLATTTTFTSTVNISRDEERGIRRYKSLPSISSPLSSSIIDQDMCFDKDIALNDSARRSQTLSRKPSIKKKFSSMGHKLNKSFKKLSFKKNKQ